MKVSEVMRTPVESIRPESLASEAVFRMSEGGFRHLPVVDEVGHVVGTLSDRDLQSVRVGLNGLDGDWERLGAERITVAKVMHWHPILADVDDDVISLLTVIVDNRLSSVPVTRDGILTGIVSYLDLLRAFRKVLVTNSITRSQPLVPMQP